MKETVHVRDPAEISRVTEIIHDCWFNTSNIHFDSENAILIVPFEYRDPRTREADGRRFLRRKKPHTFVALLKIYRAQTFTIQDRAEIERYDFDELLYDPELGIVRITSGFPFEISIAVSQFEVSVEVTREPPEV